MAMDAVKYVGIVWASLVVTISMELVLMVVNLDTMEILVKQVSRTSLLYVNLCIKIKIT